MGGRENICWKLLEMTFFFTPNIFLGVEKHGVFRRKI
jgi:hypothetical protein